MPLLSSHASNDLVKLLLMGDPSSGKTGCMVSLVQADYLLRILDYDNGLDSLAQQIRHRCPEKIDNVEYVTLRDVRKATRDGPIVVNPQAYVKGIQLLDRWKYRSETGDDVDLGVPSGWGSNVVLVIDSLTLFSDAAFDFYEPLVPKSSSGKYDVRAVYKNAQDGVENVLALLTSEHFRSNVIVTSHIRYLETATGEKKGYPTSVGEKLSTVIARYFNAVALCLTRAGGRRTIQTVSTSEIDLKNANPFEMAREYPLDEGLAKFFSVLTAKPKQPKPTVTPIRRKV